MDAVKDDLLRVAGSLKLGWVTASLFIAKLQCFRRQNVLTRALQQHLRIIGRPWPRRELMPT
jgi:TnpA family transposase